VTGFAFVVELDFLGGREKLLAAGKGTAAVYSLVHFGEE